MAADARKTLSQLRTEWEDCEQCELGSRRKMYGGKFVFGEGARRMIMFIGEGPGETEEVEGRPFIGRSGKLLRAILRKLGLEEYYLTNLVACRSCAQATNSDGEPLWRKTFRRSELQVPVWKDETPQPTHIRACAARLYEEIYLVDPILVVTLGGAAAEALLKKKVAITFDRGRPERLTIPGASFVPVLTEKRHAWLRKQDGKWIAPVEQNDVHYYCLPTVHPAWVLRKQADHHPEESAFQKLVEDLRFAVKLYERYLSDTRNIRATGQSDASVDEVRASIEQRDDDD